MKEKDLVKYINQDTWFHGTTLSGWKNLCKSKIQVDYNLGVELDFGYGFYLAPKKVQAESYIKRILPYLPSEDKENRIPVVIEFELKLSDIMNKYKHKEFLKFDKEFAMFVFENRSNRNRRIHNYDIIIGVMTDSNPVVLFQKYKAGEITREQVFEALIEGNSMQQASLHNQELCDILQVRRAILIDSGEELNADDYNRNEPNAS